MSTDLPTLPGVLFEEIAEIFNRSLFIQLGEDLTRKLILHGKIQSFPADFNINSRRKVDELCILLDGEASLFSRITNKKIDSVKKGRSFELDTLYNHHLEWRQDWVAKTEIKLFIVPFSIFLEVISEKPALANYLARVSTSVAVQKLKNDLRLLGVEDFLVREFISGMKTSRDIESLSGDHFILIDNGEVKIEYKTDSWNELLDLNETDYFMLYRNEHLKYNFSGDSQFFILEKSFFNQKLNELFKYSFVEKVQHKIEELNESLSQKFDNESEDVFIEPNDDNFDVDDFKVEENFKARGKINSILQHDMMDCGAACMSMISKFYGRNISISRWRNVIHVTREGASMLAIKQGATRIGFDAIGSRSGFKGLKRLRTPFIALMNYHYVVVYRVTDDFVTLADPEKGMLKVPVDQFKEDFSKNCILLRPNEKFKTFPESRPIISKYLVLTEGIKHFLVDLLLISILIFLLTLTIPVFYQFIFDNVLRSKSQVILNFVAVTVIILNIVLGFSTHIRQRIIVNLSSLLNIKLTALFFRKIMELPLGYFIVRNVGDISSRFGEIRKLTTFISEKGATFLVNVISLLSYGSVLFFYSGYLVSLFGLMIMITGLALYYLLMSIKTSMQQSFAIEGKTRSIVFEHFTGNNSLKATNSLNSAYLKWREKYFSSLELRKDLLNNLALTQSFITLISQLISLSFILAAILLYIKGKLTLGQVVAVNALSTSLIIPLVALIKDWDDMNKVSISLEKIDEIITSPSEDYNEKEKIPLDGDIVFEKVWFRYGSENSPWILKDLSLEIKKGQTVAFVGKSGSGKSTLSYLINLLYVPTNGTVTVNGVDNKNIDLRHLRNDCSVILQESSIYDGSVIDNICMGAPVDMERVVWAARIADAEDFILDMKDGYQSLLTANGTRLSGGQKQRINIARAIYARPKILILDEATSALDPITEKKVVSNLQKECKGMTSIIIAHRFNTIMHSDKIFVFDGGVLKEAGNHSELIRMRGIYFKLLKNQMG